MLPDRVVREPSGDETGRAGVRMSNGFWVRKIHKWGKAGHQVPVVGTDHTADTGDRGGSKANSIGVIGTGVGALPGGQTRLDTFGWPVVRAYLDPEVCIPILGSCVWLLGGPREGLCK